jgi:glucose-6-phosphate dehydrogenase assembly protein OpcA
MTNHTTNSPGIHLPWAGKLVQPTDVEETLSYLWHMSADNVRTSQNIRVRTSVLNFVICAPDLESAQKASALLRDLSSTHIGRVTLLILDTDPDAASRVSTWVTLRSFPIISDVMRHHFEQITVLASGSAANSSAHIIQPFLKPDLPIYLWWLNDLPARLDTFQELVRLSSRVIIDSNSFYMPERSIKAISTFLQQSQESALSDLNWGRITPWRQLVAQFFDAPEFQHYLAGVYKIEVEHAVAPTQGTDEATSTGHTAAINPIRALLLAGWLKSTLNWKLEDSDDSAYEHNALRGSYTWGLMRETGPLQAQSVITITELTNEIGRGGHGIIIIRPRVQSNLAPGSLCFIRLTSIVDNKQAVFTIDREDDAHHVLTSVDMPEDTRPPRTVSVAASQEASTLLHEELEILGRDYLYEDTLHAVVELLAD